MRHFHEDADPEVIAALEEAARILAAAGATVTDVTLPPLAEMAGANRVILGAEAWSIHARWLRERPGDYGGKTRRRLLAGAFLSGGDYVDAQRIRTGQIAAVEAVFRDVDVLLCASSFDPACAIDDDEAVEHTYPRQARAPFNVTGHPALAMMSGLSTGGLPTSLQLVGRYWDDALLLRVARAYERATAWHRMRPPVG